MGRLLHGFPASPSLGTKVTSSMFHTRANVLDLKELFIRGVIICKVAGKTKPGALSEGKFRMTYSPHRSLIQAEIQTAHSAQER